SMKWLGTLCLAGLMLVLSVGQAPAQAQVMDLLEVDVVEAGFGGLYRPDLWIPVTVRVTNRGADFSGRLSVRPQTTSGGLRDTYSVEIPALSRPIPPSTETVEEVTLYMIADGGDIDLRVELLNETGRVLSSEQVLLNDIRG